MARPPSAPGPQRSLTRRRSRTRVAALALAFAAALPVAAPAQTLPATRPADVTGAAALRGRTVETVRVLGNTEVSTTAILNVVRTREGEPFDPATVVEDYQRVYDMKRFANVEAKVEPTATGVVVAFIVTEQRLIDSIAIRGNYRLDDRAIRNVVDIAPGEAIDPFRIALARRGIESLYRQKNQPFVEVTVDEEALATRGELVFVVAEGPNVRIRNIDFPGATSFSEGRLKKQIQSRTWIWIFRPGRFDPTIVEEDVGAVRRYYEQKGFFDARVGRKLVFSPDQTELQIEFVVDEGVRYRVDAVRFEGNERLTEPQLRAAISLVEGMAYDGEMVQRDIREIIRAYSPLGLIHDPESAEPDYLRIQPRTVFRREAGAVELVYEISEGRQFNLGNIVVKGNSRTQDRVVLRELRTRPGERYNAAAVREGQDRLRALPHFGGNVTVTPIGEKPEERDLLVEVVEAQTARFLIGGGINSNGGVSANLTFEQRNFDLMNWPRSGEDLFSDRAFTGAGQSLRLSFEPGTTQTNASLRFHEPWLFDQPYSFTLDLYLRNRIREDYDDRRLGARIALGHRFNDVYSAQVFIRGEDVKIHDINDEEVRSFEILDFEGHTTLTSVGVQGRRDTTNPGLLAWRGTTSTLTWESFGALGGNESFQKFTGSYDYYRSLREDLLERRTIFAFHADAGWILGTVPFFERFYGGGIGSIRGFDFRGVSPRDGPEDDRVGGKFLAVTSAEVSFPIAGDALRGVVFTDVGTVESDVELDTIRASLGAGIRLTLDFFGQVPIAVDFAVPYAKGSQDDVQYISFSLGFSP